MLKPTLPPSFTPKSPAQEKRTRPSLLKNEKGMATVEMIPILMLFVLLVNFGLGFFGAIHSGILNSIAARNYAFETFRNRTSLVYLRDEGVVTSPAPPCYTNTGFRYHSIVGDGTNKNEVWVATTRPIKFSELKTGNDPDGTDLHNSGTTVRASTLSETDKTSDSMKLSGKTAADGNNGVDPVWVMTTYGICLSATCGG